MVGLVEDWSPDVSDCYGWIHGGVVRPAEAARRFAAFDVDVNEEVQIFVANCYLVNGFAVVGYVDWRVAKQQALEFIYLLHGVSPILP